MTIIKGHDQRPSLNPIIAKDINNLFLLFAETKVDFYRREGNRVADKIAREAIFFESYVPKLFSLVTNWVKNIVELEYDV